MGGLFNGKECKSTVVSNMSSCMAQTTLSGGAKAGPMSPSTTKVALDSKASSGRVTWGGDLAMWADVVGAIFSIMTSKMTPKALGECSGGASTDGNLNKTRGGGQ
jgi:hypothetical protein